MPRLGIYLLLVASLLLLSCEDSAETGTADNDSPAPQEETYLPLPDSLRLHYDTIFQTHDGLLQLRVYGQRLDGKDTAWAGYPAGPYRYYIRLNKAHQDSLLFQFVLDNKNYQEVIDDTLYEGDQLGVPQLFAYNNKYSSLVFMQVVGPPQSDAVEERYFILSQSGEIVNSGCHNYWGGGGCASELALSWDEEALLSCQSIYLFASGQKYSHDTSRTKVATHFTGSGHYLVVYDRRMRDGQQHSLPQPAGENAILYKLPHEMVSSFRFIGYTEELGYSTSIESYNEGEALFLMDGFENVLWRITRDKPDTAIAFKLDDLEYHRLLPKSACPQPLVMERVMYDSTHYDNRRYQFCLDGLTPKRYTFKKSKY